MRRVWQVATIVTTMGSIIVWVHWLLSDGVTMIAGLEFNDSGRLLMYMLISAVPTSLLLAVLLPKVWNRYNPAALRSRRRQRLTDLQLMVAIAYKRLQMVDGYDVSPRYGPDPDLVKVDLSEARAAKDSANLLYGPLHRCYDLPDLCTTEMESLRSWYKCLEQIRIDIAGKLEVGVSNIG